MNTDGSSQIRFAILIVRLAGPVDLVLVQALRPCVTQVAEKNQPKSGIG
jgi:hypothetical protein